MVGMRYVRLGRSGLKVSVLCLGMMSYGDPGWRDWVLDQEAADPFVRRAVELGVNFFDTADIYSLGRSEEITGALLRKYFAHRDDYVVATKVYNRMGSGANDSGLSRKHIMASVDNSLRRLGTDYIDLYQIHRWDDDTPIEETMAALADVVRAGKARYIGASSMWAWQFAKAQRVAEIPFVSMQNHYNLVYREEEREMIPQCLDMGVGVLPWSPLARGFLAGNRTRDGGRHTARSHSDPFSDDYYGGDDYETVDRLTKVAGARALKPAVAALAWLLHKPAVSAPIVGATKLPHLEDAAAAVDVSLSDAEIAELEEGYRPHPVLGHR